METEFVSKIVKAVLARVFANLQGSHEKPIPIGVSNRHVHLSKADLEVLFGPGYELRRLKELSQPGQYACAETVILAGPKGCMEQVRILGPARPQTQVEVLSGDGFRLGVDVPVRESGALAGSAGITLIGPKGSVALKEGMIAAKRHIHMTPEDAACFCVADGQSVALKTGGTRGLVFDQVIVRVSSNFSLECHIDMEEANAAGIHTGDSGILVGMFHEILSDTGARPAENISAAAKPAERNGMEQPIRLVTEETVKAALKIGAALKVSKDTIFTPLAQDTIREQKAEIIFVDK